MGITDNKTGTSTMSQSLLTDISKSAKRHQITGYSVNVRERSEAQSKQFGKILASVGLITMLLLFPFAVSAEGETTPSNTPTETTQSTPTDTTPTPTDNTTPPQASEQTTTSPTTDTTQPESAPQATGETQNTTGPQIATGPQSPTGPDANKYTLNTTTGLWENDYYTWNPKTGQTSPKTDPKYYFDPTTKTWSTDKWVYSPESGKYIAVPTPVGPLLANQLTNSAGKGSGSGLLAPLLASILGTGPNSDNSISSNSTSNGFFDLFSHVNITNNLGSSATSGDASVSGNTTGGSALTGDASVMSNVINAINSVFGMFTRPVTTYLQNIYGTVSGDIALNPDAVATQSGTNNDNSVGSTGPNSNNTVDSNNQLNTEINAVNDGSITNNINLNAQSGNATVSKNTTGGDANSGMASAVANVMNLINSSILSGNSFMGMINIFGDYSGNILFPPGFLDSVLAASNNNPASNAIGTTGPNSNNTINGDNTTNTNVNNTSTNAIANNLNLNATSGNAEVTGNTQGGSATTGNADSNVTLINMTGQQVIGKNAFLVMVNVLGHWVGMIMNAPAGTTSAVLGSNATANSVNQTGPDSNNQINSTATNNTDINATNNNSIVNNINANATSGDATVSGNTQGGNATSGNAKVAANIVNISNSNLSLSDWFGVLFINVFGNWVGNVGSGNPTNQSTDASSSNSTSNLVVFVPNTSPQNNAKHTATSSNNQQTVVAGGSGSGPTIATSSITSNSPEAFAAAAATTVKTSVLKNLGVTFTLLGLAALLFVAERILYIRKQRTLRRTKVLL